MKLIDGKEIAQNLREKLKNDIEKNHLCPGLAIILVGNNEASELYVHNKEKACLEIGIKSHVYHFNEANSETEIIACIEALNNDTSIHGIIVQSPLPSKFNEDYITSFISETKDVDGFGIYNMGLLATNNTQYLAATPAGIINLLETENIPLQGTHVVIIGRSKIVGRPLALALLNKDATVTITHSKTKNLKEITKTADILIVAIGHPKYIDESFVKENAVIIDVGINKLDDNLCGDVDFASVKNKVSYITPVPGGVGPMTVASLLSNVVESAKIHSRKEER